MLDMVAMLAKEDLFLIQCLRVSRGGGSGTRFSIGITT